MAELKTKETDESVEEFLNGLSDQGRREDCFKVLALMRDTVKAPPKMWGGSIVGFGNYRYKYESGREGDWFIAGFSPRKDNLTLYIMPGIERYSELLKRLGKYKTGKSCLYIRKLADIDVSVLEKLVEEAVAWMSKSQSGVWHQKTASLPARGCGLY